MKKYIIFSLLMAICFGAAAQEQRYAVKSGIITMEMDMMGQAIVQEIYFDDYGAKQATVMNMRGQKTRNIVVDGKTVMVTGAAGSIGSELCRQLAGFGVSKLVLFDNAETPMHNIRLELEEKYPDLYSMHTYILNHYGSGSYLSMNQFKQIDDYQGADENLKNELTSKIETADKLINEAIEKLTDRVEVLEAGLAEANSKININCRIN